MSVQATQVKKQIRPVEYDVADDEKVYMIRKPSSARKYQQPVQKDAIDDSPGQQAPIIPRRRASGGLKSGNGPKTTSGPLPITDKLQGEKRFPIMAVLGGM